MRLAPFWSYYGSKWRIAGLYPRPLHKTIIEPFAGSACYSLMYPEREVILCDSDPVVAGIWRYLLAAKESEVLALPVNIEHIDETAALPQEARWLIGFWLGRARMRPALKSSTWARSHAHEAAARARFWGPAARLRIARQLQAIRHWQIIEGRSQDLANRPACWFVDAPYQGYRGRSYRRNSRAIDYVELGSWCISRCGQVIVCEAAGADWLPFERLTSNNGMRGRGVEMMWTNLGGAPQLELAVCAA